MSKRFWTSDTHFLHQNVITYCNRPWKTVEEMTAALIQNWNSVVSKDDVVYILGDFSLSKKALEYVKLLNGTKHLIMGNHDHCHPLHAKKPDKIVRMVQLYLDAGFSSIKLHDTINIGGYNVLMHHMPYTGDHEDTGERYVKWRPKNEGSILLHGHVHDLWKTKDKMINVGVDVWNFKPVSEEELLAIIKTIC